MEREESSETEWWKVKEAADKRRHSTKTLDKRNRATERRQRITKKYKRCKKKKKTSMRNEECFNRKPSWTGVLSRLEHTINYPVLYPDIYRGKSENRLFHCDRAADGKYAVLSRNCCIIDARVGSSSYCLSAEGITLCESGRWSHPKRQNDCWINLRGHHLWHTLLSPPTLS